MLVSIGYQFFVWSKFTNDTEMFYVGTYLKYMLYTNVPTY